MTLNNIYNYVNNITCSRPRRFLQIYNIKHIFITMHNLLFRPGTLPTTEHISDKMGLPGAPQSYRKLALLEIKPISEVNQVRSGQ